MKSPPVPALCVWKFSIRISNSGIRHQCSSTCFFEETLKKTSLAPNLFWRLEMVVFACIILVSEEDWPARETMRSFHSMRSYARHPDREPLLQFPTPDYIRIHVLAHLRTSWYQQNRDAWGFVKSGAAQVSQTSLPELHNFAAKTNLGCEVPVQCHMYAFEQIVKVFSDLSPSKI